MAKRYEVEALINRRPGPPVEYEVVWRGYPGLTTWEPASILKEDCPALVKEFDKVSPVLLHIMVQLLGECKQVLSCMPWYSWSGDRQA